MRWRMRSRRERISVTVWILGRDGHNYDLRNGDVIEVLPGEAYYLRTKYPEVFP